MKIIILLFLIFISFSKIYSQDYCSSIGSGKGIDFIMRFEVTDAETSSPIRNARLTIIDN